MPWLKRWICSNPLLVLHRPGQAHMLDDPAAGQDVEPVRISDRLTVSIVHVPICSSDRRSLGA